MGGSSPRLSFGARGLNRGIYEITNLTSHCDGRRVVCVLAQRPLTAAANWPVTFAAQCDAIGGVSLLSRREPRTARSRLSAEGRTFSRCRDVRLYGPFPCGRPPRPF